MLPDFDPTDAGGDGSHDAVEGSHDIVTEPTSPGHPLILLPDGPAFEDSDAE